MIFIADEDNGAELTAAHQFLSNKEVDPELCSLGEPLGKQDVEELGSPSAFSAHLPEPAPGMVPVQNAWQFPRLRRTL